MAENKKEETNQDEDKSPYEQLTNTQKCAILMMLLGEEEASDILKNLGPKEVQQLGKEMYNVQGLDQDTVNKVLDEFLAIIKTQTDLGMGSSNYIKNVMTKALGENKAQSVLGRITPTERPLFDANSVASIFLSFTGRTRCTKIPPPRAATEKPVSVTWITSPGVPVTSTLEQSKIFSTSPL